jgi:hypothetical protein
MYLHGFGLFSLAEDFAAVIVFSCDIFKAYLYQPAGPLDVHGNFNDESVAARAFQFDSFLAFYMHSEALHNPTKNCEENIARRQVK